jgi:hypothetical protein
MAKIPMNKTRDKNDPYLIIDGGTAGFPGWEWRVLKAWSKDPEAPYARWLCAVRSPWTCGGWDMGDTYVRDIAGVVTYRHESVPDEALPKWLR